MPYVVNIQEDAEIGATVFENIQITDADSVGSELEVECVPISDYSNACEIFSVQPISFGQSSFMGVLVLEEKLNYARQDSYRFMLKASVSIACKM